MRNTVVRGIVRADADAIAVLGRAGVATVHEAAGRTGLFDPGLRPLYDGAHACGSAITVLCPPGDNLMVHAAVECCAPGDMLVVAFTSPSSDGAIGELLVTSLRARGVVGLVIDAGVRDVAAIREMQFPVWSRAISAQGTVKATAGSVNVPVVCGGQAVVPGDAVVGDDDGIVCIPRSEVLDVGQSALERIAREDATRVRLAEGELGLDIYKLRDKISSLGVTYIDVATDAWIDGHG